MPHRLRTPEFLFGLPELESRVLETARIGNYPLRQAVTIVKGSISAGRSGYLENPATSRVWIALSRLLRRELAAGKARIIVAALCGYGTHFKKPTRLLIWGEFVDQLVLRRCGGKRGLCAHSGAPHLQLTGVTDGLLLTHHAQVYCEKFVADILEQLQYRRRFSESMGHTL